MDDIYCDLQDRSMSLPVLLDCSGAINTNKNHQGTPLEVSLLTSSRDWGLEALFCSGSGFFFSHWAGLVVSGGKQWDQPGSFSVFCSLTCTCYILAWSTLSWWWYSTLYYFSRPYKRYCQPNAWKICGSDGMNRLSPSKLNLLFVHHLTSPMLFPDGVALP